MTIVIADNSPRISYVATQGQTVFTIPFEFFDDTDINLYINDVLKELETDYTVSGGDGTTGTLVLVTGATVGDVIVLTRSIPLERVTDFPTSGPFQVASLNVELDKVIAMIADLEDLANRGLRLSDSDTTLSLTLASKDVRKGTVLAFNATTGAVEVGPTIADTNTVAQIKADISTVAGISGNVTTVAGISSDVTTVAGISADVTTVAGNESNIQDVVDNLTDIQNASTNASEAATSASNAASSETAAASSASSAATSEANAGTSATNAATSASSASSSASTATTKASEASTSATNAATSETNAANSATNAATSETNAATSASNAATSESNASTSETNAATSATNASGSATAAATSESNAATSETNAATSESNAASSASSASTSASTATTKASEAATSASNAATSETNAATSETNAASSASAAATSASNAATSESNAATSASSASSAQTAAEAARDSALAAFDNFDDKYLGEKASDPTLDNDGDALVAGALYFNTTDDVMKVYSGSSWVAAYVSGTGFVSTSGDTMTGDLSFGDNDKAIFGAGSDLEIYHDGANTSYISTSTGNMVIQDTDGGTVFIRGKSGENSIIANDDSSVRIFFDNAEKLATTSTGINVFGTVTADGLSVEGTTTLTGDFNVEGNADYSVELRGTVNTVDSIKLSSRFRDDTDASYWGGSNVAFIRDGNWQSSMQFNTAPDYANRNGLTRIKVASNGDISFYEDTGTTPKLTWDASAERLILNGTSYAQPLVSVNNASTGGYGAYINTAGFANTHYALSVNRDSGKQALRVDGLGDVSFYNSDGTAAKFFWDASAQQLGVGTNSPEESIHIIGNIRFGDTAPAELYTNSPELRLGVDRNNDNGTTNITFYVDNSERVRIDSSGNLLVGTTTANETGSQLRANGQVRGNSSAIPMFTNRIGSDGILNRFQKSGTTVGGIGTFASTTFIYGTGGGVTDTGLAFANGQIVPCNGSGVGQDDVFDLGTGSNRFDDVFATNGTINTSDGNEKQDIEELTEAEQRVAVAAKGLLRKFRWKSRVEEKGDDARIHFGIIAQDLQAAFEAEGLDAGRYAMFTNSIWTDEETGEERSRMGVRYNQLLAFIIAAI